MNGASPTPRSAEQALQHLARVMMEEAALLEEDDYQAERLERLAGNVLATLDGEGAVA